MEDVNSVPLSEETVSMEVNLLSREYNFEDDVFVGGEKDKGPKETRSEKRKRQYEHARAKKAQEGDLDLDLTKEELHKLQEKDPLIQNLRKSRPDQVVEQKSELRGLHARQAEEESHSSHKHAEEVAPA